VEKINSNDDVERKKSGGNFKSDDVKTFEEMEAQMEEEEKEEEDVEEEVDRSKEVALPAAGGSGTYNLDKIIEPSPSASIQVRLYDVIVYLIAVYDFCKYS
jgi:hypothetical protein